MTVEERAIDVCNSGEILWRDGYRLRVEQVIIQALRDQIEDCAKILDEEADGLSGVLVDARAMGESGRTERAAACLRRVKHISQKIRAQSEGEKGE